MSPQDLIYITAFKKLMSKGHTQKRAGDYAARSVFLWSHGRTHDQAIKLAVKEAGKAKKPRRA